MRPVGEQQPCLNFQATGRKNFVQLLVKCRAAESEVQEVYGSLTVPGPLLTCTASKRSGIDHPESPAFACDLALDPAGNNGPLERPLWSSRKIELNLNSKVNRASFAVLQVEVSITS